jgi:RluA family pseudouridine synthase
MSNPPAEPERYELSCVVDPYRDGWTLAEFLSHRFRYHPPDLWRERLAEGAVRVNGEIAGAEAAVRKGDRIEYTIWHAEPAVDFRHEVLHEDAELLAVSKSGNLPVHAGGKFIRNTLIAHLRPRYGDELRPVHRLDRETSGVVLLAKTREAARALEVQFRERRVGKEYVAVLRGRVEQELVVDGAIARREPAEPPYFRVVEVGGKPAVTRFRPIETAGPPGAAGATLVTAEPEGGRTNQIRVHAAHAGHPILGDKIYGVPPELARRFVAEGEWAGLLEAAGAARHLLHCAALTVEHPADGSRLRLEAAAPPDLRNALERVSKGLSGPG